MLGGGGRGSFKWSVKFQLKNKTDKKITLAVLNCNIYFVEIHT